MNLKKEISLKNAISYCIENNDVNTATYKIIEFIKDEDKAIVLGGVIKRLENLQRYYCDGDAYGSGCWMSKEDKYEKGDYVRVEDLINIIQDLKLIFL